MGKLIDSAVAHFNSKEIRQLRVDEWDCTLYSKNLSLSEKSKWLKRANGDGTDYLVYAVIYGVTDEKGENVFDIGDKTKLKEHVDPEVVSMVANFVLDLSAKDESEREKN
jgi:hypothetical protein